MKKLRVLAGGGVLLAALAVAVLGLGGTFAGAAGESAAQEQYEFALDHYKCHIVTSQPRRVRRGPITVVDQFGRHTIRGRFRPRVLCAPASKDQGPVHNEQTHLVGYILPFPGDGEGDRVAIGNQFGREELRVGAAIAILLPASKSRTAAEPGPVPTDVDHYLCYSVDGTGETGGHTVDIEDQFGFRRMTLADAGILCAPALKNPERGEQPINAEDHLVCYELSPLEPHRHAFRTRDQFALLSLRLTGTADLCVPSKKAVLPR